MLPEDGWTAGANAVNLQLELSSSKLEELCFDETVVESSRSKWQARRVDDEKVRRVARALFCGRRIWFRADAIDKRNAIRLLCVGSVKQSFGVEVAAETDVLMQRFKLVVCLSPCGKADCSVYGQR